MKRVHASFHKFTPVWTKWNLSGHFWSCFKWFELPLTVMCIQCNLHRISFIHIHLNSFNQSWYKSIPGGHALMYSCLSWLRKQNIYCTFCWDITLPYNSAVYIYKYTAGFWIQKFSETICGLKERQQLNTFVQTFAAQFYLNFTGVWEP